VKRILVTGSNGLLGQKLVHLIRRKDQCQLFASSKGRNRISDTKGYTYIEADLEKPADIVRMFKEARPDVVINTAALTNVDLCETEKVLCKRLNVDAVAEMCAESKAIGAHFIHLSTDFVFNGEAGPYRETDAPDPLSYYGWSKAESERVVMESGLEKWAIARTIIVYGLAEEMSRSNIVLWAKEALEQGKSLSIVDDQFRAPTLAEDLARGCFLIAEKGATGIYHLSGKDIMSIFELVQRVGAFYGLDTSTVQRSSSSGLNQAAKRPPRTGFILDKARTDLGYDPHSFEEGLAILAAQLGANH
jgi:dTDP-4-dehydrorhamnose reductase